MKEDLFFGHPQVAQHIGRGLRKSGALCDHDLTSADLSCDVSGHRSYIFSRESSMIKKLQKGPLARMLLNGSE